MKRLLFVLFALAALACVPPPPRPLECRRDARQQFHVDTEFTPAERAALAFAAADWREFSGGRVVPSFEYDLDFARTSTIVFYAMRPIIIRAQSWMRVVTETDLAFSARAGRKITVYAWTEMSPLRIYLVVDRIPDLRRIAAHELGHAAGLEWPSCAPGRDCDHVEDRNSIMAPAYGGAQRFTEHDLELCRASCLCP